MFVFLLFFSFQLFRYLPHSLYHAILCVHVYMCTRRMFLCREYVCVYVNCYSTPLARKLLEVMDTLYIRFFKYTFQFVLVLLCCCCCCFLFTHKCQTLWLICSHYTFIFVCVRANDVLSISIFIFFST